MHKGTASILRSVADRRTATRRPNRLRQERGLRTEAAILDATLRSVAKRGVHETSLDAIAAEVGVAKSSILWHFGSKEELLLRVAERAFSFVEQGPAQEILGKPTFPERAEAWWSFFTGVISQHPEVRRVILYLIFVGEGRPELRARLRELYRSMRRLFVAGLEDVVADRQERQQLATLVVASLDGIFLQWLVDPGAIDLEALHEQVQRLTVLVTSQRVTNRRKRRQSRTRTS